MQLEFKPAVNGAVQLVAEILSLQEESYRVGTQTCEPAVWLAGVDAFEECKTDLWVLETLL